jgi:hypothetical protein
LGTIDQIEEQTFVVRCQDGSVRLPMDCVFRADPWEAVLICTQKGIHRYLLATLRTRTFRKYEASA